MSACTARVMAGMYREGARSWDGQAARMAGAAGAGAHDAGMEHDAADAQRTAGAVPLLATQARQAPLFPGHLDL